MKSISLVLALAATVACVCVLQSEAVPFSQPEVSLRNLAPPDTVQEEEKPQVQEQMEKDAPQQEQHWAEASEEESRPEEVLVKVGSHPTLNGAVVTYCYWEGSPHTVCADGAVGVEVEGHQVFWTCGNKPSISVLTTVPPHTDSLVVSTKTKTGLKMTRCHSESLHDSL
ncbi:hypothetical protein NFI96_028251, partial [Prochilodus magdalenae]